jgi:hypothetical protein
MDPPGQNVLKLYHGVVWRKGRNKMAVWVIADDLTGANDTIVQFAKWGMNFCNWRGYGFQFV